MKNLKVGDKKVFVNTDEEGVVEAMDTLELATADWAEAHWQYAVDTARWYSQWAQLPYVVDLGVTTLLPIAP